MVQRQLNERIRLSAVMETTWLVSFLLLLSVQALPSYSLPGLSCINNLFGNITCTWNSSEISPEVHCVLQGKLQRLSMTKRTCDLKHMEGQDHTLKSCQLLFDRLIVYDIVSIDVKCGNATLASVPYKAGENVKLNPPDQPIINNFTISWSQRHLSSLHNYVFELQFKLSDQPWQDAETAPAVDNQMSVELPQNMLEIGRSYQARVRVKPREEDVIRGMWSSWSPIASWKSEVGKSPWKGLGSELRITLGLVAAVTVSSLLLITCGWFYKQKFPHVPNPSTYFEALNSVHGGNFQKWLGPLFVPESFDVTPHFEDISPVVIFKADNINTLLYNEHPKDPAEQWDSSSKYPGSYSLEEAASDVSSK
ncbi:hypothetical protein AAFF_G00177120 [Aldrovandia affinis]|uniref:Interleukin-2 receptor subunit beta N-terminal domain-containing protein n=1 Tax=Aldrovandia affinis TaxID=143900 RepID=A0AAD7RL22_9TELE|nr:hypothetical protein AAFF_G00177120 [Aldrovandia affinis]